MLNGLKFYCELCDDHKPVEIEKCSKDDLNPNAWGDIVCADCKLVIATFSHEKEGELIFKEKINGK